MLAEDQVPLADRCLLLEGQLSPTAFALARFGLPGTWPATAHCFWVSYPFADLALGTSFDVVFPRDAPDRAESTHAVLHAVTQQFGKPFDTLPHGWKTICVIGFPAGVPAMVDKLPHRETWSLHGQLALCRRPTLDAIRANR